MSKNFFITLFCLILFQSLVVANDWDDFKDLDKAWDGQKAVTNKEFDDVLNKLNEKKELKNQKKRKKLVKKISGGGTSLHKELNYDVEIKEIASVDSKDEGVLLNVPVDLYLNGKRIERGYYKLVPEKNKEQGSLVHFYQSQKLITTLKVEETEEDFEQELIDFAELLPFNDSFVKLIFGSLEFNAYAYIQFID